MTLVAAFSRKKTDSREIGGQVYKAAVTNYNVVLPHRQIKYPVDFDDELKIGDVRYDDMT